MKNIGIITFHASYNCGSILQSYAMQTILEKSGMKCEIIDFSTIRQRKLYGIFYDNSCIKNVIKNLVLLSHTNFLKSINENYSIFIKKNLNTTKMNFKTNQELCNHNFNYNIVISGSDQIWNVTIDDADKAYFLNFISNVKKIAYAPSFGAKKISNYVDDKELDIYKKLISDYDYISIREENGKKWIKELFGIDVPVVLDPTLLLEIDDYKKLEEEPIEKFNNYIFYYAPSYSKKINKMVKKIANKYNYKIVVWNPKKCYLKGMNYQNFIIPKKENPGVYLSLIKNASLVITTSFHGTIFSCLYRKNFWTIKNGEMYETDDRVLTLVKQLGISERLISEEFDNEFNYTKKMNYDVFDKCLEKERLKSKEFLYKALGHE